MIADEQSAEVGATAGGSVKPPITNSCSHAHFSFSQSLERPLAYGASARLAMSPSQPDLHASANRRSESPRDASDELQRLARAERLRQQARGARSSDRPREILAVELQQIEHAVHDGI